MRVDVDQQVIEAARRHLVDQMVHKAALGILHLGAPKPVGLVTHEEVAGAVLIEEVVAVHGVHAQTSVDRGIAVLGAFDPALRVPVEGGNRRRGGHGPAADDRGREADLPGVSAGEEARHRDPRAVGSDEFSPEVHIEGIA